MLNLAFPAKQEDDVILKTHLRCRSCLLETFALVPVSRQPADRSDRAAFIGQRLWEQMPFRCGCGHTAADLVTVGYAKEFDLRWEISEPVPAPTVVTTVYCFERNVEAKPDLFPQLGLPRLMRCG